LLLIFVLLVKVELFLGKKIIVLGEIILLVTKHHCKERSKDEGCSIHSVNGLLSEFAIFYLCLDMYQTLINLSLQIYFRISSDDYLN